MRCRARGGSRAANSMKPAEVIGMRPGPVWCQHDRQRDIAPHPGDRSLGTGGPALAVSGGCTVWAARAPACRPPKPGQALGDCTQKLGSCQQALGSSCTPGTHAAKGCGHCESLGFIEQCLSAHVPSCLLPPRPPPPPHPTRSQHVAL